MGMLGTWKNALTNPKKTFAAEKRNASVSEGAKQYAVSSIVLGLLVGLLIGALAGLIATILPPLSWLAGLGIAAVLLVPIGFAVFTIIASLVGAGIMHVMAGLLGGKGKFEQLYYLAAIFAAPIMLLSVLLNVIPLLGWLLAFLLAIYQIYLYVLVLKYVYGLSTERAIVALILPFIILLVLAMVIGFAVAAAH